MVENPSPWSFPNAENRGRTRATCRLDLPDRPDWAAGGPDRTPTKKNPGSRPRLWTFSIRARGCNRAAAVDAAIQAYQKAIALYPEYAEALLQLGLTYASLNRYPEATQAFKEVVRLQPQSAMALGNLGAAYMKLGRFPEARDAFQKAVRLHPDDPENHYRLGLALGKMKRDREALAEFSQAVKLQPDMARAHRDLGLACLNLGRLDKAGQELKEAAALDPKDPQVHYDLSAYYARTGDVAAANREFKTLQGLDPDLARKLVEQIRQSAGILPGGFPRPPPTMARAAAANDPGQRLGHAPPPFLSRLASNCQVAAAAQAGGYSLCGALLRLRQLYKWEQQLPPWREPEPAAVLEWIEAAETPGIPLQEPRAVAPLGKAALPASGGGRRSTGA